MIDTPDDCYISKTYIDVRCAENEMNEFLKKIEE
jgi:hypothetical protein